MERVLLSSVFFNGYETLEMMIEKMIAEMFYLPAHQELYKVFVDLYKEDCLLMRKWLELELIEKKWMIVFYLKFYHVIQSLM